MPAEASTAPGGLSGRPPIERALDGSPSGRLAPAQVRTMFDRIAGIYDPMNTAMTAGLHHRWRARAADLARVAPGSRVLDVATGTGDLALELARRVGPDGEVVGSDFSLQMLARAREKARRAGLDEQARSAGLGEGRSGRRQTSDRDARRTPSVRFERGDALALPYDADCFDAATVGFGARNFDDLARGLSEMVRVVRPGGRVVVLEITTPTRAPLSSFYRLWFDRIVPALGKAVGMLAARRAPLTPGAEHAVAGAYAYLPSSVRRFPSPTALAEQMRRAGLCEIGYVLTAGGIIAIHAGTVAAGVIAPRIDTTGVDGSS